jgi:hypothetical protein
MITLHPAVKVVADGFVPMVTLRGSKGQMMGSKTPSGGYREFRTFTNEYDALTEARLIVLRCALRHPEAIKACAF